MARRQAGNTGSRTALARTASTRSKAKIVATESPLKERLSAVERERDSLRAALQREQERVRRLEELNAAARDRISWALDSLQNILDAKR